MSNGGARAATRLQRGAPLYLQAYAELSRRIEDGTLQPGQALSDQQLATLLGISRTPVREAVRLLVLEGLLVGRPHETVTVFSPGPREVAEVYLARGCIEGLAASLIASLPPNRRRRAVDTLAEHVRRGAEALARGDVEQVTQANTAFHSGLVAMTESEGLVQLYRPLALKALLCRRWSLRDPGRSEIAGWEHQQLLEVLARHAPAEARGAVERHVWQAGRRLLQALGEETAGSDPVVEAYLRLSDPP